MALQGDNPPVFLMNELLPIINSLEQRLLYIEALVKAVGLPIEPWVSPTEAARLLQVSPNTVRGWIVKAEDDRVKGTPTDFQYGLHYRNVQSSDSQQPAWRINVSEAAKFLNIPPDKRKY